MGSSRLNQNVAPRPGSLTMPISPPICSTSPLTITRPRPVPPYWRVIEASAWLKSLKTLCCWSFDKPIPVSLISTLIFAIFRSISVLEIVILMWPAGVNLMALFNRLVRICLSRRPSLSTASGVPAWMIKASSSSFSLALGARSCMVSSTTSRRLTGAVSSTNLPASNLEKSSMSLMMANRLLAELWMVSMASRWRCSSSDFNNILLNPIIPLSGVRISWLVLAKNSDFIRLALSASRRARSSSIFCTSTVSNVSRRSILVCSILRCSSCNSNLWASFSWLSSSAISLNSSFSGIWAWKLRVPATILRMVWRRVARSVASDWLI